MTVIDWSSRFPVLIPPSFQKGVMMSITAQNISYRIGQHQIFSDLSFTCEPHQMIALSGPSGSGKTTLLGILGMLTVPTEGSVAVGHMRHWTPRTRRMFWKDQAAFIWQDYGIIDNETVSYNVTLRRHLSAADRTRLAGILSQVGLAGREKDRAITLSGGEQQRVGIARALWKKARYIFADEPTASLDQANRDRVEQLLRQAVDRGACVIVSTHDAHLVDDCDKVITLGGHD